MQPPTEAPGQPTGDVAGLSPQIDVRGELTQQQAPGRQAPVQAAEWRITHPDGLDGPGPNRSFHALHLDRSTAGQYPGNHSGGRKASHEEGQIGRDHPQNEGTAPPPAHFDGLSRVRRAST